MSRAVAPGTFSSTGIKSQQLFEVLRSLSRRTLRSSTHKMPCDITITKFVGTISLGLLTVCTTPRLTLPSPPPTTPHSRADFPCVGRLIQPLHRHSYCVAAPSISRQRCPYPFRYPEEIVTYCRQSLSYVDRLSNNRLSSRFTAREAPVPYLDFLDGLACRWRGGVLFLRIQSGTLPS